MEGRRTARLLLSATLAGLCLSAAAGCGEGESPPPGEPLVGAIVADSPPHTFAPIIYMHPDERYLPMSGNAFIIDSTLFFGEDSDCEDHRVAVGRDQLPRLTEEPTYAVRPYEGLGCRRRSTRRYASDEITRPHENTPERVLGLRPEEGFYLDLDDRARGGAGIAAGDGQAELHGAAAWYEEHPEQVRGQPGRRVTQWLLYGMHAPRRLNGRPLPTMTHEGDWERVDVLLRGGGRRWKPVGVELFDPDGSSRQIPWSELRRLAAVDASGDGGRTHPVLFAALGTHTLYARPGTRVKREVDLAGRVARTRDITHPPCRACPRWETQLPGFSLESQHWYGFGGAWGERGPTSLTTGPLGPQPR